MKLYMKTKQNYFISFTIGKPTCKTHLIYFYESDLDCITILFLIM